MSEPVLWTSAEAAEATGGAVAADWQATGVSIDSRAITPGDLFVAIRGPNFDGHDFVAQALRAGAVAAMVAEDAGNAAKDGPLLVVKDTMDGLNDLGRAARARTDARIIAVTGSVGKTGTKEALTLMLSRQGATSASTGNLNNQWGVPLSLARMPAASKFGVFELGMNRPGEIRHLTTLVRPHVALITAVESVHVEFFPSLTDIAAAKAEIFIGMNGGRAVLNRDNRFFELLSDAARARGIKHVATFGHHIEATARIIDFGLLPNGSTATAVINGQMFSFRIGVAGRHWILNSVAALATLQAIGADVAAGAAALKHLQAPPGRGARCRIGLPGGTFELIDESYNASPASMAAAIDVLGLSSPGAGGRRIAVLGDMLELGDEAPALHRGLSVLLRDGRIHKVFTAGPLMANLSESLLPSLRADHAESADDLAGRVTAVVRPGDVVMVKGSLGSRMAAVVDALLDLERTAPRASNG